MTEKSTRAALRPANTCDRCGHTCQCVEAWGLHYCPNCGEPVSAGRGYAVFSGSLGCKHCGIEGRPLKSRPEKVEK